MRTVLHVLTKAPDDLVQEVITRQHALPDTNVEVMDLCREPADYSQLLERIFAADSVAVW